MIDHHFDDPLVILRIVPAAIAFNGLFAQARFHFRGEIVDRLVKTIDFFLCRKVYLHRVVLMCVVAFKEQEELDKESIFKEIQLVMR